MMIPQFEEYLELKGRSKSSIESTLKVVKRFRAWLEQENMEEEQVSHNDVLAYISSLKVKQITVQNYLNALDNYFIYLAKEAQIITENPIRNVQIKGVKKRELYDLFIQEELDRIYEKFPSESNTERRNKVILGLLIYQGLKTDDLGRLKPTDLLLREGKIQIESTRKSNARLLELRAFQIIELQDYISTTREEILHQTRKGSDKLFVSFGSSDKFGNIMQKLMQQLRKENSRIKSAKQIRASVITVWLKHYNLRQVQYMAGHRFVSSTEKFMIGNLEGLQDDIDKFHPID